MIEEYSFWEDFLLIRYPGSKAKHVTFLQQYFPEKLSLCEPMFGAGAVSFHLLQNNRLTYLHINDIDPGITSLWETVRDNPEVLMEAVDRFEPSVDEYIRWKEASPTTIEAHGFRKMVLHQLSYSGLGEVAGSPIGGWNQHGKYKVGCRWSVHTLKKNIYKAHKLLNSIPVTITTQDVADVVEDSKDFLYLDPPYYKQGPALYKYGIFNHKKLHELLKNKKDWVLSYDNVPEICALYADYDIIPVDATSHMHHRPVKDVVIYDISTANSAREYTQLTAQK